MDMFCMNHEPLPFIWLKRISQVVIRCIQKVQKNVRWSIKSYNSIVEHFIHGFELFV